METKSELVEKNQWYPPRSKTDLEHLGSYCGNRRQDNRSALTVLSDIDYHAVGPDCSGPVKGFSFDRANPISGFTVNIQDSETGERIPVNILDLLKFERIGPLPSQYTE